MMQKKPPKAKPPTPTPLAPTKLPERPAVYLTTRGVKPLQYQGLNQPIFESTPEIGSRRVGLFAKSHITSGTNLKATDTLVLFKCNVLTCTDLVLLEQWASVKQNKPQSAEYMVKLMKKRGNVAQWLRDLCVLHGFVAVRPDRTYYVLGSIGKINHACVPNAYLKSIAPAGEVSMLLLVMLEDVSEGEEITIEYNVLDTPRVDICAPWCEAKPRPAMDKKWNLVEYSNIRRQEWYFDEMEQTYKVGNPDDMDVSCRLEHGVCIPCITDKIRIFTSGSAKDTGLYSEVCSAKYEHNGVRGGIEWRNFREVQKRRYGVACRCDRECFQRCIVESHGGFDQRSGLRLSNIFDDDDVKQSLDLLAPARRRTGDAHEIRNYLAMNYYATVKTAYNVLMVITPPPPAAAMAFDPTLNCFSHPVTSTVQQRILAEHMRVQGERAQQNGRVDGKGQSNIPSTLLNHLQILQQQEMCVRVDMMREHMRKQCPLMQQYNGDDDMGDDAACNDGMGDDAACNDGMDDEEACNDGMDDEEARSDGMEDEESSESVSGDFEDEEMEPKWLDMRRRDGLPAGMENTGNSCFIAACVQILLHSGCYDNLQLCSDDVSVVSPEKDIAFVLLEMFDKLRNYESIGTLMLKLRKIFKVYDNDVGEDDQNDALVFLNSAILCIEAHGIPMTYNRIGVDMLTVTKCAIPGCFMSSISDPTAYTDVTLPMQASHGSVDRMVLQYALDAHMSEGNLREWHCGCGVMQGESAHQVGRVTNICHQTPKFLLLTVNRVQRDYQALGDVQPDRKINHLLDFPLENLGFGDIRHDKDNYGSYNLLSLIRHEDYARGQSRVFSHGHYISIARVKNAAGDMQWLEFNDAKVGIISEQQLESDIVKRTVVALLYQRQT